MSGSIEFNKMEFRGFVPLISVHLTPFIPFLRSIPFNDPCRLLQRRSPLWDLENVLITAHNADYTANYFELGCEVFDDNVEAFLACRAAEERAEEGTGGRGIFSASLPRPSGMATPVDLHQGY